MFELPRLMLITDRHLAGDQLLLRIRQCLEQATPGSVVVQLRDRDASAAWRLETGRALRALTRDTGHQLSVSERLDLARLLDADAVHLPEVGVPAARVQALVPGAWCSRAWHVDGTSDPGVHALVASPAIAPRKGRAALGLDGLASVCASLDVPVYALGGVDAESAGRCIDAGAHGVAVIGAALDGRSVLPLLESLQIQRR
ncbi:MAG: thiamine phosphate synthase [Polyangiaceae bacterium]|nr:thiamine phosphate synthase [Polyangiaceae bacterium]